MGHGIGALNWKFFRFNGLNGIACFNGLLLPSQLSSASQSILSSPNHPDPFPADMDCFWLLKAPPGGHVFLQFVDQFAFTCEDTCDKSFVELKTGPDFRVTGYRFCNLLTERFLFFFSIV